MQLTPCFTVMVRDFKELQLLLSSSACEESHVRQPGTSAFYYWANEFCS